MTSAFAPSFGRHARGAYLLLALLSVAGCGRSSPSTAPPGDEATSSRPEPAVRVAAASDLQFALREVVGKYNETHSDKPVEAVFGSSGSLFAQLSNKAPFDMFLSADMSYPQKLVEAGLAAADSEFLYAIGHLVVWVPKDSTLDFEKDGIKALTDPSVKVIAMANPQHAPYGRVAEAALKNLGVYDEVKDRLVLGENIAQTAQFVQSGAAHAGLIALSLALAPAMQERGRYWSVPADAYPRLEQGGVIMSAAQDLAAARDFRAYLISDEGKAILRQFGFELPEK
ncbi:MAG TPA: molybdate ABC transporter substrate-binding protein [Pirellulales bacterium]|nr:molybdate ABC transporter substrate-binding protein [Pirellulales bacterium]